MTARHSTLFTLESGQSGLGFSTTQRDAASDFWAESSKLETWLGKGRQNQSLT
jgi:hypothetical protein